MNAQLVARENVEPLDVGIVPAGDWDPNSGDALLLSVDKEPEERFVSAPLIAIEFPAFNDGRGLSLAVLLRTRHGFTGELRAVGDVRADMIHYLYRCGFDSFLMSDAGSRIDDSGLTASTGSNSFAPYSNYYQASVLEPRPPYARVRRGT